MNVPLTLLIIGTIAIIVLYNFWTFNYWKKRGVKVLRPNLLFGNLSGALFGRIPVYRMFKEVYETCKKNGDKCMGFYFINTPALVIVDPELLKQVLIKDFNHFTGRQFYLDENDPLTSNLASAKGNQWKKMKEQLTPAFTSSKMRNMCCNLLRVGDQLKSALDKSAENYEVVNLKDVASKYMADAIGMSIFGLECNTNLEFEKFSGNIFGGSLIQNIKLTINAMCPSVLHFFKTAFTKPDVQNFYFDLVKSIVKYRETNKVVRNDVIDSMIKAKNYIEIQKENVGSVLENERSLKVEDIAGHAILFVGAAYETSMSTISLCIYELAANEFIQNNLRNEITSVLQKYEGKIDYDAILEMTYLNKCISETLRKYAVGGMTSRICTNKYQVPNTNIVLDEGTTLYFPIYEIQNDPEYYPNPERFDPERFSPECKSKRPSCSYLAFGQGQRYCIGARLGLLQLKIFMVTFLKNYNFSISSKVKFTPTINEYNLVVSFKNPLYLNIQKI